MVGIRRAVELGEAPQVDEGLGESVLPHAQAADGVVKAGLRIRADVLPLLQRLGVTSPVLGHIEPLEPCRAFDHCDRSRRREIGGAPIGGDPVGLLRERQRGHGLPCVG